MQLNKAHYIILLIFLVLIIFCNKQCKKSPSEFYSDVLYEDIVSFSIIEDSIRRYKNQKLFDSCFEQTTKEYTELIIVTEVMIEYFDSIMKSGVKNGYEIIAVEFYGKEISGYTFHQNYRDFLEVLNASDCHYNKQLAYWLQPLYEKIERRIGIGTISEQKATLFLFKRVLLVMSNNQK